MADDLREKMPLKSCEGMKPMFSPEGEMTLMFLKPYVGMGDDELVHMFKVNINMQIFCGVLIAPAYR